MEGKALLCELCGRGGARDYAEDFELQTALADYIEEVSGERINISDISSLCEECYDKVSRPEEEIE